MINRKKQEKKQSIIAAAAGVFAEKGYSGAVIADVAAAAGIGKGTVYEYFSSKEDLFFGVFEWFSQELADAVSVNIAALAGSASDRLKALNDAIVRALVDMKPMYSLVMEFWSASAASQMNLRFKTAFKETYAQYRGLVSSLIQDGIDRGEYRPDVAPEPVAAALVGTWDALGLQAWFDEDFDPAAAAGSFMAVMIQGMKK